jgi:alpha-D-ribose 1-methylphosphonate 5-triphosphate synthase subunit PhnG
MGALARAEPPHLAQLVAANIAAPHETLRGPETGLIMVRGRMGGDGGAFNLGEMTVTRCSVTLASGAVGHAMTPGRDAAHARNAALVDALLADGHAALLTSIIDPLLQAEAARREACAAASAATRVDFFTVARGEDPA